MANIVGLNDGNLLSADNVYDSNQSKSQQAINTEIFSNLEEVTQNLSKRTMSSEGDSSNLLTFITNLAQTTGGRIGSISLNAYGNIPACWYNYIWIPHRVGGTSGDNSKYGTLLLFPMTSDLTYAIYKIRYASGTISSYRGISGTSL